ncbi:MAG: M15 family metallopeptidase [Bacilli bacterium]
MAYKPKKMWKPWVVFLFLFILFFATPFIYIKLNDDVSIKKDKLDKLGYSISDIEIIKSNKVLEKYALENKYDENLAKYAVSPGFQIKNLKKYYAYKKNDANIEDIVFIVNLGIEKEYSDALKEIVHDKYFVLNRLDRYLNYDGENKVKMVNCDLDSPFYSKIRESDIDEGILMLTNKYNILTNDFEGLDLVEIESNYGTGKLNKETYEAFKKMKDEAALVGLTIIAKSNFRSYNTQNTIYNNYLKNNGLEWTEKYSARPGHSEHQTGLATDVKTNSTQDLGDFLYTEEYKWMIENSYKFGFILRYPENSKMFTGYDFEPWHFRYIGVDAAKTIHEENILFEEYYAFYVNKTIN